MRDPWSLLADPFVEGADATVKGRVRTQVIHEQLLAHLPAPPATILDVGGGAGHQSRPLARIGYEVTILDSSPAMLERAEQRLANEANAVRRRVTLIEGCGEEASVRCGGRAFDVVLCHGVVMYLADPAPLVASISACAAPGGVVSLVALNAATMAVRPALERRWADALAGFDARHERGVLGVDTRADTVEGLSGLLSGAGVAPEAWYGVWLFSDLAELAGSPLSSEDLEGVAAVERLAASRDPYRQLSRLFHLLGRRR